VAQEEENPFGYRNMHGFILEMNPLREIEIEIKTEMNKGS
jgi:hypothetical protein